MSDVARSGGLSRYMVTEGSEVDAVIKAETLFSNWIVHQNLQFSGKEDVS